DPAWPAVPANESDVDGDGVRICAGDCDDANASVWATPGEVRDLRLTDSGGMTTLTWSPPASPGGSVSRYDTIRSLLPYDFVNGAVCVESDGTDTTSLDGDLPPAGSAAAYLVRCKNDCPQGDGSLGADSNNVPRVGRTCP